MRSNMREVGWSWFAALGLISACCSNRVYKCQITSRSLSQPSTMSMFSNFAAHATTSSTTQFAVSLASILFVYGIYKVFAFVYDELTSPLRHVPGPPSPSLLYGSFKQLSDSVS